LILVIICIGPIELILN